MAEGKNAANVRLTQGDVYFNLVLEDGARDFIISAEALHDLERSAPNETVDLIEAFHRHEARICGVARRLAAAGVNGNPTVLKTEFFP